jgi:DNA-binding helix-hairpin-helix protein with protein kinase domain
LLGSKNRLSQGANGTIYELPSFSLVDEPGSLVYKEYRGAARKVSLHGLLGIIDARLRLEPKRRRVFDEMTVWPLRVVTDDGGAPLGVVMRLIPGQFIERMKLPSGKRKNIAREVQHLIFDPGTARQHDVAVPADRDLRSRLRICERLALTVAIMHAADLVYGDLSARNILYRLSPRPSVLLVDCDAARVHGSGAVNRQQDSPDWDPPETAQIRSRGGSPTQSLHTDRYKLALFVLRCLTPGRGSSTNRSWGVASRVLDRKGRELMTRALEGRPEERPAAKEWVYYLRARLDEGPMPPVQVGTVPPKIHGISTLNGGWKRDVDGRWIRV